MSSEFRKMPVRISGLAVEVKNGNVDKALRLLSKKVQSSGILREYRERQEYEKPSVKKRKAKKAAIKKYAKMLEEAKNPTYD